MNALPRIFLLAALVCTLVAIGPESSRAGDPFPPQDFLRHKYPEPPVAAPELQLPPYGGVLVRTRGCLDCHRFGDQGSRNGVDLSRVGRRLDAETLDRLLRHPREVNPEATMPAPPLTRDEAFTIATFLFRLR